MNTGFLLRLVLVHFHAMWHASLTPAPLPPPLVVKRTSCIAASSSEILPLHDITPVVTNTTLPPSLSHHRPRDHHVGASRVGRHPRPHRARRSSRQCLGQMEDRLANGGAHDAAADKGRGSGGSCRRWRSGRRGSAAGAAVCGVCSAAAAGGGGVFERAFFGAVLAGALEVHGLGFKERAPYLAFVWRGVCLVQCRRNLEPVKHQVIACSLPYSRAAAIGLVSCSEVSGLQRACSFVHGFARGLSSPLGHKAGEALESNEELDGSDAPKGLPRSM